VKTSLLTFAFALAILLPPSAWAQQGKQVALDITITVQGYELPRKDAAAILQALDARLDASTLIQQVAKARAKLIKLGTVKTGSGERAGVKDKDFQLEVEPLAGPDGRTINLALAIHHGVRQLFTEIAATDGSISFLGTLEDPAKDAVELVFLRATLSRGAP
jgi:hypothetical protein